MKGLDREELEIMGLVARGRCVLSRLQRQSGAVVSLLKRGLVVERRSAAARMTASGTRRSP